MQNAYRLSLISMPLITFGVAVVSLSAANPAAVASNGMLMLVGSMLAMMATLFLQRPKLVPTRLQALYLPIVVTVCIGLTAPVMAGDSLVAHALRAVA